MNFISAIKVGWEWLTGKSTMAAVARTALLAFTLNKINKNANKGNDSGGGEQPDPGAKIQLDPATDNAIPVLYGHGFIAGAITEAVMSDDRQTMYYVLTLSEVTGTKLSDDLPSEYSFLDVYRNDQRVIFKNDSFTVDYTIDREGNIDISARDLIKIRVYAGNSNSPLTPDNYATLVNTPAYDAIPTWDASYVMNDLIFAVIEIKYSRDKNSNELGEFVFEIKNTMDKPGDCLYDYMTNTRYGAGIPAEDIYSE